ncbi:endothelin-converting enzyme 1-like protein, partial [Leptotrombidium deliense]
MNYLCSQLASPQYFLIGHILEDPNLSDAEKNEKVTIFRQLVTVYLNVLKTASSSSVSNDEIESFLDDMISFERSLVKIGVPYYETVEDNNQLEVNFTDLNKKFPELNLINLFKQVFESVKIELLANETFQINDVKYFEQLAGVLKGTDKKILANYAKLRILQSVAETPITIAISLEEKDQKETLCSTLTEKIFGLALSRFYVKYYLPNSTVQEMKTFVTELKAALTQTLQSNEWMDDGTKLWAQLKLNRMYSYIAIPSWITSDDDLDKVYGD